MTDKEVIDSFDDDDGNETGKPFSFAKSNKYVQIIFVGLLVGAGLFGVYLIMLGATSMTEAPQVISSGNIDSTYPFGYTDSYYKSDKRNELHIFNNKELNAKSVFIGTPDGYQAWKDMKLMGNEYGRFFTSQNGKFNPNDITFNLNLKYYNNYETLQDQMSGSINYFVIVYDNDPVTMEKFTVTLKGNQTNPELTIVRS